MTIYMASPDGSDIKVGHNVYEVELGNYFMVTDKKNFEIKMEQALTAGQNVNSIQVTELKSSEAEVYWLESIILRNNIKLWMKYRDKEMFSTNVKSYLDFDMSNIVSPFNINKWMYNYVPTAEMTENANLAVTAAIHFKGITFELRKYRPDVAADLKVIDDIKAGKVKCWNVRG